MLALAVALAAVVGIALGLLGGGGSILMVPLLVYVAGMDTKEAIATSLVVVGVTAAVGVVGHARAGRVRWRTGLLFGLAGMAGAFAGGFAGGHLPGPVLMGAFAVMMVATAAAMLRGRRAPAAAHTGLPVFRVLLDGVLVGLATGLVGAGGGFLVVPALTLLAGLPMAVAVGTSLLVIAMKSAAGLAGYLATVPIDWPLTAAITAAAVLGSLAGSRLVARIPADALRRGFGWFVLAVGAFVLAQQLPDPLRVPALLLVAGIGVAVGTCVGLVPRCPLRRLGHRATTAESCADQPSDPAGMPGSRAVLHHTGTRRGMRRGHG